MLSSFAKRTNGFRTQILYIVAYTLQQLIDLGGSTSFRDAGFDSSERIDVGSMLKGLVNVGSAAWWLRSVGFNARQLIDLGFPLDRLRRAGFDANEIIDLCTPLKDLVNAGFALQQLKRAGVDAGQLVDLGIGLKHLRDAGFSARELTNLGISVRELIDAGFSARMLFDDGLTLTQILAAQQDVAGTLHAEETALVFMTLGGNELCRIVFDFGNQHSIVKSNNSIVKSNVRSLSRVLQSWFGVQPSCIKMYLGVQQLGDEYILYSEDMSSVTFRVIDPKLNLSKLRYERFEARQLYHAGCTAEQLRSAGFNASELLNAGVGLKELMNVGFAVWQLMQAGVGARQLVDLGVPLEELRNAGFTVGELVDAGAMSQALHE